jgi:retinol dehydrogenase-12
MELLMPALERGALSSPDKRARVVHTSSLVIYSGTCDLFFDTFVPGPARDKTDTMSMYRQSKAGNIIVALEAVKRHAGNGVVFTSTNPGLVRTEILRHKSAGERLGVVSICFYT